MEGLEASHPEKQGLVQGFSVYVDTWLVCSATAFMIMMTGMYNVTLEGATPIVNNLGDHALGPIYNQKAVESVLPDFEGPFNAISLLFLRLQQLWSITL